MDVRHVRMVGSGVYSRGMARRDIGVVVGCRDVVSGGGAAGGFGGRSAGEGGAAMTPEEIFRQEWTVEEFKAAGRCDWVRDRANPKYYVDADGFLWFGPVNTSSNTSLAKLECWATYGPCWVLSRSNPAFDWAEVSPLYAAQHMRRMLNRWCDDNQALFAKESKLAQLVRRAGDGR